MKKPSSISHRLSNATPMIMSFTLIDQDPISTLETTRRHSKMLRIVSSTSYYQLRLNPTWARGYQRKGTALFYLNKV
jgi:hypothetical protein